MASMLFYGTVIISTVSLFYVMIYSTALRRNKAALPNIIFILADDLGWSDISIHGAPQIPTPNLDALASSGILFNNYYGERLCTPSRAALLTGKYPIRLGLQHFVLKANEPSSLPLEEKIMPEYFRELGYATHMIGKWHLGYKKREYTPTYRGFDSFFGYYNGFIDYYDYTHIFKTEYEFPSRYYGTDLHNATGEIKDVRGQYATDLFTDKAKDIINSHDESQPLFLYLSHLAVHLSNFQMPLQAPYELVNRFDHIKSVKRRTYAGMVAALDKSVGDVFEALYKRDLLSNTIFIFASDNGAEANVTRGGYGSNYPLRGNKMQVWEGGVRVPAFIWSPLFQLQEPRISKQMMHVTDWLPTLYTAAGGDVRQLGDINGQSIWEALLHDSPSPRQEILHNIDPIDNNAALRRGDFKLVTGDLLSGRESWYGPEVLEGMRQPKSMDGWVFKNGSTTRDILLQMGSYLPPVPDTWRYKAEVRCKRRPEDANECNPALKPCLFNIKEDPCETFNVADAFPEMVQSMLNSLQDYQKQAVKPQSQNSDPYGDPMCHGFAYVPWMEPEHISNCPFR